MVFLIYKKDVADRLQVAQGYFERDFNDVFIREAQELDLKPLMPPSFYARLMRERKLSPYNKLLSGGEYEYDGQLYNFAGVATVVSYFAYARFIFKSNIVSTSHGFVVKDTPYSTPIPMEDRRALYNEFRKDAGGYFEEAKIYIERNLQLFPKWKQLEDTPFVTYNYTTI